MWFIALPIALLVVFFAALFIDSFFLNGKYLNRSPSTGSQLKKSLAAVLSQADRPIESWDPTPQDWIADKMRIPLKDSYLDAIRLSVVGAIGDPGAFKRLTPEMKSRIQEAIAQLK